MRRYPCSSWRSLLYAVIAIASLVSSPAAEAIDRRDARLAVDASVDTMPGDDAIFDYRPRDIRIVDLDRNGIDEIVYRLTATCKGATTDCPNAIAVMTALQRGDKRLTRVSSEHCPVCNAQQAAIRASGYADDASEQVPGEIERIVVERNRITVTFVATLESPVCRRFDDSGKVKVPTTRCPPPGRYRQTFRWAPGTLEAVGTRVRIRTGMTTAGIQRRP